MFGLGRYGGLFGHISLVNVERVSLILVERSCDACTSVELLQVDLFPLANLLRVEFSFESVNYFLDS